MKVRIPAYRSPRNSWRKSIHRAVMEEKKGKGIYYRSSDKLEVIVTLYLHGKKLLITDVDNRLKDVLDALQGRAGGPKKERKPQPVIPNDNQIYKVTIEKMPPPRQSHGLGHLVVRKYKFKG